MSTCVSCERAHGSSVRNEQRSVSDGDNQRCSVVNKTEQMTLMQSISEECGSKSEVSHSLEGQGGLSGSRSFKNLD